MNLPRDIAGILEPSVARTPQAEALVGSGRRFSYAQLSAAVTCTANWLASLGIGQGDRVACSLANGCDIIIAFMATQRLGAIWVGINRILPAAEIAKLLRHSETSVLLSDAALIDEISALRAELPSVQHVCELDTAGAWLESAVAAASARLATIDPHAPAAILYTSGTTGEPKGIVHSQHTLITPAAVASQLRLWGAPLRRGVVLPLTITNVMVIAPLLAFANGVACVCTTHARAANVVVWIEEEGIEAFSAVPTIIYDLIRAKRVPTSLRTLISGGAPLPVAVHQAFQERFGFCITNTYGLTEAPTIVTDTRGEPAPEGSSGRAMDHLEVTIRDDHGRALPPNTVGEICVATQRSGRWRDLYRPLLGYWRDPQRTAAAQATPWLRTGDIGRLDEAGWLYVVDRKSDLILRGGSNVYPQEIVRVLERDARVVACAVIGIPDERFGERTVAFVQPVNDMGDADLIADLKARCAESLPTYKHPDYWHVIDELPRNSGGKVILADLRRRANERLSS